MHRPARHKKKKTKQNKKNTTRVESCGRVKMIYVADALCGLGVYRTLEAMPCQHAGAACLGPASGALLFLVSFSKCRRRTVLTRSQSRRRRAAHARQFPSGRSSRFSSPFRAREPRAESRELICCVWSSRQREEGTHAQSHTRTQVRCSRLDWILKHKPMHQ